jgi:hypothetical protein
MHRSRAPLLLLFAVLAFGDARGARAQEQPVVVAPAAGVASEAPDPEMRALLQSLPRDQRRAVVRELRSQPAGEREAWRKRFLAQPAELRPKQIDEWTAQRNAVREELRALPPADRRELREKLAAMKPEERKELREQVSHLKEMSPEERSALRERIAQLATSTPEERARLQANMERWEKMPPAGASGCARAGGASEPTPAERTDPARARSESSAEPGAAPGCAGGRGCAILGRWASDSSTSPTSSRTEERPTRVCRRP